MKIIGNTSNLQYTCSAREQEILEFLDSGKDIEQFLYKKNDYFFYYHLSPIRKNAVNWIKFPIGSKILEVNPEFGAITDYLKDHCESLICLTESTSYVSSFIKRFEKCGKIKLIIDDMSLIEENVDFIIFQGCNKRSNFNLEITFNLIKQILKQNGKAFLMMENSLGIRYLTGAKFENGKQIEDFYSKKEIQDIVNKFGLSCKFYYPVPDYRFPNEIYNQYRLPKQGDIYGISPRYEKNSNFILNEEFLRDTLIQNNLFENFFNSFIIEVSKCE